MPLVNNNTINPYLLSSNNCQRNVEKSMTTNIKCVFIAAYAALMRCNPVCVSHFGRMTAVTDADILPCIIILFISCLISSVSLHQRQHHHTIFHFNSRTFSGSDDAHDSDHDAYTIIYKYTHAFVPDTHRGDHARSFALMNT